MSTSTPPVSAEVQSDNVIAKSPTSATGFRLSIFLGAFLLFLVQPLVAKFFLPWFGGAAAVWTTCMLFFQTLLLAGYAYAHGLASVLKPRAQTIVHFCLLLASVILLVRLAVAWPSPLTPGAAWKPHGNTQPIGNLLALLTVSVGLPYFVLSTTGPLLQAWFARSQSHETPYRLYAVSNLASFLALLSYPFLVEPWLPLKMQARVWSLGFAVYAVFCAYCAVQAGRKNLDRLSSVLVDGAGEIEKDQAEVKRPGLNKYLLWLSLAACGSVMLLASTNQICQDIAVIPLLWILPLSLYLLSFVICFDRSSWYSRSAFHPALAIAIFAACYVLSGGAVRSIAIQVAVYSLTMFIACMVCHGELHRSRPAASFLTSFYLIIALGGALGGIFVGLVAPHIFSFFWEYEFGLCATVLLMFIILLRDKESWLYCSRFGIASIAASAAFLPACTALASPSTLSFSSFTPLIVVLAAVILLAQGGQSSYDPNRARAAPFFCGISFLVLGAVLAVIARSQIKQSVLVERNFYGVLTVKNENADQPEWQARKLVHGRIVHGIQFLSASKRDVPTSYFNSHSGVGQAFLSLREFTARSAQPQNLRIGIVGLGIGTLAAYCKPGDYFRFYEINPHVIEIASDPRYFTYLQDCPAKIDIVLGDARISLEDELRQGVAHRFDLLVIDAFSGDAIPAHLLTLEAFQMYWREIKPGGLLAIHITNTYLDLRPVVIANAEHLGLKYRIIHTRGDNGIAFESIWALITPNQDLLNSLSSSEWDLADEPPGRARLWTDDYSNLFQVVRW